MNLFMVLIGCKPTGRHTEQHDVFFGIANELRELIHAFENFCIQLTKASHNMKDEIKLGYFKLNAL
jgi:hypothetical protein